MSSMRMKGAVVTLYADEDIADRLTALASGTAFALGGVEPGPVPGTVSARFVRRSPEVVVAGGNLVDLMHRIQRHCEVYGAHRLDDVAVPA